MRRIIVLAVVAGSVAVAGKAAAQTCMAFPVREQQLALAGNLGFLDNNTRSYGGALGYNLPGQATVSGGVSVVKPDGGGDTDGFTVGGNFGYELSSSGGMSACPIAGFHYRNWAGQGFGDDENSWTIPIGLGLGTSMPLGNGNANRMILNAFPHFQYISSREGPGDDRETGNEFGLNLNLVLHNAQIFGGAGVGFTTLENVDPAFTLSFGMLLGSRSAPRRASLQR
jgi:hypothetical protein